MGEDVGRRPSRRGHEGGAAPAPAPAPATTTRPLAAPRWSNRLVYVLPFFIIWAVDAARAFRHPPGFCRPQVPRVAGTGGGLFPQVGGSTLPGRPTSATRGARQKVHMTGGGGPTPGKSLVNCKFVGIGSCAPPEVVTNVDLEGLVETTDEWIKTRTGISSRHILNQGESLRGLATNAALRALEDAGIPASDVGLVIVSTSSADDLFGDATSVAAGIGASSAVAYDLTAACSGFLFGIVTAGQFLHTGAFKHAVVVGADALTRWVDWTDRNSCILFGDGAGAVVLSAVDGPSDSGLIGFAMHSDGKGYQELNAPFTQYDDTKAITRDVKPTIGRFKPLGMNGREVYKFATRRVPEVIEEALGNAGMTVDQVDWLLLHQANIRIMEVVAQALGIPADKILTNLSEYGNTSAGSIPLALDEAVRSKKVKKGDVIACAGFGAGLSWGAAIIKWGGK